MKLWEDLEWRSPESFRDSHNIKPVCTKEAMKSSLNTYSIEAKLIQEKLEVGSWEKKMFDLQLEQHQRLSVGLLP